MFEDVFIFMPDLLSVTPENQENIDIFLTNASLIQKDIKNPL